MALKVGIQLYSVREEMAKDPFETIRRVAEIGYKNLEVANSRADQDPGVGFDVPADKLLEILGGFGAQVVSSHIRPIDETTLPPSSSTTTKSATSISASRWISSPITTRC